MDKELIKSIYEADFRGKSLELSALDPQGIFLRHFLPKDKEIKILDAGCGNGKYANMLYHLGYENIEGIDLLDVENFKDLPFSYKKADIKESGYRDEEFDFLYSFSVIFYLQHIEDGIKEFHRILKKDGILILTAHTKYSLHTLERMLKRDRLPHLQGVRFYSANHYKRLLEKNGFEILHIDGFNTSYFLYPTYRKISNRFNLNLPKIASSVTLNKLLGRIRSEISYHSVIVAKKIPGGFIQKFE